MRRLSLLIVFLAAGLAAFAAVIPSDSPVIPSDSEGIYSQRRSLRQLRNLIFVGVSDNPNSSAGSPLSASPDSLRQARLAEKMDQYVDALTGSPLAVHAEECDFLIGACKREDDRTFVAMHLYQHYLDAKWMGAENVAVHIADNWILNRKVALDDVTYYSVFAFAEFNRASLVGEQALPLTLKDRDGNKVELQFGADTCDTPHAGKGCLCTAGFKGHNCSCGSDCQGQERYTVLYFYSPTCATCRVNTPGLVRVLKSYQDRVVCYAITVNTERDKWDAYLDSHPEFADIAIQLWDPDAESDFPLRYGVLQTPQLLLITPEGRILGRRLDPAALQELLHQVFERDI